MGVVRVGVLGCGTIARLQHIPALLEAGAEVVAFAGRTLASAEAARDQVGGGWVTDAWEDLLARDDVDAVTICTPNALHAPMAIAAAKAAKHVLVEKPFATSTLDADAMIDAAAQAGVVLMAAHNVRFAPPFAAMRKAVADGLIGDVTSARVSFCHAGPQAWAPDARWFRDADQSGGGALTDLGVHVVDTLAHVLDDTFVEVGAVVDCLPVDEDAVVTFRTSRGTIGTFHAGWRSTTGPDQGVVLHGTTGTLLLGSDGGAILRRMDEPEQSLPLEIADNPCAAFVRAIREGAVGGPMGEDGRAAVAVVEAAYEAARTGQTQKVAQR